MATIQSNTYNAIGSGTSTSVHTPTVTGSGRDIIVCISSDGTARTFSVSSNVDGAFGAAVVEQNPDVGVHIFRKSNVTAGAHTITATASATGTGWGCWCFVIEDLPTGTVYTDTLTNGTLGDDHLSGATGITTTTNSFVMCVSNLGGSVTSKTAGSGYTDAGGPAAGNQRFCQYGTFASPLSANQGAWTSATTNRQNDGVMAAFEAPTGGGGLTPVIGSWLH